VSTQVVSCYRHPERETGVRCQRCQRPICAACMIPAPVGMQCPECVRGARSRVISGRSLLAGPRPVVTYALIAANLAVWGVGVLLGLAAGSAAGLTGGDALAALGGLYGPRVAAGEWWRILTAGFLHAGLLHVGMNMLALFVFGPPLEASLGRLRFSVLYLASLVAGSLGALLLSPNQLTVGASGAIFGLLGALLVGRPAGIRAAGVVPLLLINLVFTVAVPGISIGGHLGGLVGGLVAGGLLFNRQLQGRNAPVAVVACLVFTGACFWAATLVAAHPLLASGLGPR
jgi:membrane associated rhomboid family serine protease